MTRPVTRSAFGATSTDQTVGRTTLLRGGSVYSPVDPFATAMVVEGGSVAWVGSDDAAEGFRDGVAEVVELDGALVTPAFVDAHVHVTATGLALLGLDLSGCESLAAAVDRFAAYARAHPGELVIGQGWDDSAWPEGRPLSAADVERAAPGVRAYLPRVDAHAAVVSPALLDALGGVVDSGTGDSGTGDSGTGDSGTGDWGLVTGDAHHEVRQAALATLGPAQRVAAQRAALARAAEAGIGAVHEMAGPQVSGEEDLTGLLRLVGEEAGPDVVAYWGELGAVDKARALGAVGAGGDLFVDGSLGARTACVVGGYGDPGAGETGGVLFVDGDAVAEHLVACVRAGVQGGFHAIGDEALRVVLREGFARAERAVGVEALRSGRHRVEHAEMLDEELIGALLRYGVVASVQPAFDAAWGGTDGMYARRLGVARAARMNPLADLARAGVPLAFGSDAPVTPLDPWGAVRAAAWHRTPGQRVSVRAGFSAHTRGGWRAAGVDEAGVLAPGAPATFAVWRVGEVAVQAPDARVAAWSTDPRSGLPGLPVLEVGVEAPVCVRTVVRGRVVFDRAGSDRAGSDRVGAPG